MDKIYGGNVADYDISMSFAMDSEVSSISQIFSYIYVLIFCVGRCTYER